jgi:hypothetical protein
MNENNLTISVRDLKEIRKQIINSEGVFKEKDKVYKVDKDNSVELLTDLIDVVRVRNGIIYG